MPSLLLKPYAGTEKDLTVYCCDDYTRWCTAESQEIRRIAGIESLLRHDFQYHRAAIRIEFVYSVQIFGGSYTMGARS
jgi:hypothetical protein